MSYHLNGAQTIKGRLRVEMRLWERPSQPFVITAAGREECTELTTAQMSQTLEDRAGAQSSTQGLTSSPQPSSFTPQGLRFVTCKIGIICHGSVGGKMQSLANAFKYNMLPISGKGNILFPRAGNFIFVFLFIFLHIQPPTNVLSLKKKKKKNQQQPHFSFWLNDSSRILAQVQYSFREKRLQGMNRERNHDLSDNPVIRQCGADEILQGASEWGRGLHFVCWALFGDFTPPPPVLCQQGGAAGVVGELRVTSELRSKEILTSKIFTNNCYVRRYGVVGLEIQTMQEQKARGRTVGLGCCSPRGRAVVLVPTFLSLLWPKKN